MQLWQYAECTKHRRAVAKIFSMRILGIMVAIAVIYSQCF